ncbi:MAG: NUDIX domain-containing protein [Chloroflexi bacterium]|nr:NUDIX domain-containing protein [Chloroflexota bacterium]
MTKPRYGVIPRVLCFLERDDQVLLLRGAPTKRLWPNLHNGIGGHVERGETPLDAARREIREEAGLQVERLHLRAIIHVGREGKETGVLLFVFAGPAPPGEPRPSAEGTLHWVPKDRALGLELVGDLPWLLPKLWSLPASSPPFFARYDEDEEGRIHVRKI